jgi:hypothetical protein
LLTFNERTAFAEELASQVAASPHWGEWMKQPDRYLDDLDSPLVTNITDSLGVRLDELRQRANERGWDLPD